MNLTSSLNLASESPLEKQENRKIFLVWQHLNDNQDASEFRKPVDWAMLGLSDYQQIVKNPMDLETVQNKLQTNSYKFVEEVLDDIQLIWDNCKIYNQSGSWIYALADKMEKFYRKLIRNYFSNVIITIPQSNTKTQNNNFNQSNVKGITNIKKKLFQTKPEKMQDQAQNESIFNLKIKLVEKMKKLSPDNLGILVESIMNSCPDAIAEVQEGKFNILMQNVQDWLISELTMRIQEMNSVQDKFTKKVKNI